MHISDEDLPDEKQAKANIEIAEEKKKKKGKMVIAGFNDDKPATKKVRAVTFTG